MKRKKQFLEAWRSIEGIVERQSLENKNKSKIDYWEAIKSSITNKDIKSSIKTTSKMEEQIISMIDKKISEEKDDLYYAQVKAFTRNFSFLRDYPELIAAVEGHKSIKFTDKDSYNRFYDLRNLLQQESSEYYGINKLLSSENIDNGDRRVLEARREVIKNKEAERKSQVELR